MPLQSSYWLASDYSERVDAIHDFLQADKDVRILVVLDKGKTRDAKDILDYLNLMGQLTFYVRLIIGTRDEAIKIHKFNPDTRDEFIKTIYIVDDFNTATTTLVKILRPVLAIFV
jgi:hypothetical protein